MSAYYRGNNYKPYRSPRRSVRRVRRISDGVYWRVIATLAVFVLGSLYYTYTFFVG